MPSRAPSRSHRAVGFLLIWSLTSAAWLLTARHAQADATVAVALASGRIFVGQLDSKTDDKNLYLSAVGPGITIRRPIQWSQIVLACSADRELSPGELRAMARSAEPWPTGSRHDEQNLPPRPWPSDTRLASYIEASRANNTLVQSLSIEAHVANWNQTVESDGIIVHVYPQDGTGFVIPVDGTLDVELIASVPPGSPQRPLPRIGRWSVRILPEQFGPLGAVVKLPFQSVKPDFDLGVGPLGLVHASLSVPGNGSFETSQAMVRIRPYSAVRDQAQQNEGRRFFDVERVNRP